MGRPTAFLRTDELPSDLRASFVIPTQRTAPGPRGCKRALVLRRCRECGRENWLLVSNIRRRLNAGLPVLGLCASCNANCRNVIGEAHPAWKGGRFVGDDGYIHLWERDRARRGGGYYRLEHRIVMERILGRPLRPKETVHHINGNRQDNLPENLELWAGGHPSGTRLSDYHCPGCQCFAEKGR